MGPARALRDRVPFGLGLLLLSSLGGVLRCSSFALLALRLNALRVLAACEANGAKFQAAGELASEVTPATFGEDHSAGNYDPAAEEPVKVPPAANVAAAVRSAFVSRSSGA